MYKGAFGWELGQFNIILSLTTCITWACIANLTAREICDQSKKITGDNLGLYLQQRVLERRFSDKGFNQWKWAVLHYIPMVWFYYATSRRTLWPIALLVAGNILLRLTFYLIPFGYIDSLALIYLISPALVGIGISLTRRNLK